MNKGIVYCIKSLNSNLIYIGSSKQSFANRKAKQKLREQEVEQSLQAETEFYEKITELRELDKLKERLEKSTRDDIMTLEDEANELSKKMAVNLSEVNRLEKDTRSLKEHL